MISCIISPRAFIDIGDPGVPKPLFHPVLAVQAAASQESRDSAAELLRAISPPLDLQIEALQAVGLAGSRPSWWPAGR